MASELKAGELAKQAAGRQAAALVQNGMVVGLGSGSTANAFHVALAERMKHEGLNLQGVAPSKRTEDHCAALGIPVIPLTRGVTLDLAVDGADEVAPDLSLIKGGGGALVREKLVIAAAKAFIVVADTSKIVPVLGKFPLPVAIFPFGWERTLERLEADFGVPMSLRGGIDTPFVSDDGLYIVDMSFGQIPDPATLNTRLRLTVGVADCGLFVGLATQVITGDQVAL